MRINRSIPLAVTALTVLASCGGDGAVLSQSDVPDAPTADVTVAVEATPASGGTATSQDVEAQDVGGVIDRATFDLCGPMIANGDAIAAAAGFESAGADQHTELATYHCQVSGLGDDAVRIEMIAAIFPSIDVYVEGYDIAAEPVPEFGETARLLPFGLTPHLVFPFGGVVIDVEVSSGDGVDPAQLLAASTTVRDTLAAAAADQ